MKTRVFLAVLLVGIAIGACQAPPPQCCRLIDGVLQPNELQGSWKILSDAVREMIQVMTSIPNDEQVPAAETVEQYLSGHLTSDDQSVYVIHQLRSFQPVAPLLVRPTLKFFETEDPETFSLNVRSGGQSSQTWCQGVKDDLTSTNQVATCVAKVRYEHLVSIMVFLFNDPVSDADIATLINGAISATDERLQAINQHLSDSSP